MQMPSAQQNRKGGVTCERAVIISKEYHVHGQVDSGHTEDGAQEDHDQDDLLEVVDDRLDLILHRLLGVGHGHLAVLQFQLVVG